MPDVLFITHPDVQIDPHTPVPDWTLSGRGRARMKRFARDPRCASITALYSSDERKAKDGADILAQALNLPYTSHPCLHENDRSATGFLEPTEFEATADRFFAEPDTSVRGWERAVDAQARIVRCVKSITDSDPTPGDIAIIAHGAVGALLLCHLLNVPISRRYDQPGGGGGNLFRFERQTWGLEHMWEAIDAS